MYIESDHVGLKKKSYMCNADAVVASVSEKDSCLISFLFGKTITQYDELGR